MDNEIANGINSGATDEELQAKRDQQTALQTQLTTATANRDALTGYSNMVNTLSTTRTALQNATVLLNARKDAESSLNSSTEELRKTLQSTISSLNDQLTKAQTMLTQLNDQRGKLQTMLENLEENPVDPSLADMAVQLLLSGSEAQLQLGEFQLESGRTPAGIRQSAVGRRAGRIRFCPRRSAEKRQPGPAAEHEHVETADLRPELLDARRVY